MLPQTKDLINVQISTSSIDYSIQSRLVSSGPCSIRERKLTGRVPFLDIAGVNVEGLANFATL